MSKYLKNNQGPVGWSEVSGKRETGKPGSRVWQAIVRLLEPSQGFEQRCDVT